jgi:hypothetical protein
MIPVLEAVVISGFMGAMGQSVRAIIGLKGLADDRADPNVTDPEAFNLTRLVVSLVIGFVAGVAAGLTIGLDKVAAVTPDDTKLLVSLCAAGYAGTDFIEGFMASYLPGQSSQSTQSSQQQPAPAASGNPPQPGQGQAPMVTASAAPRSSPPGSANVIAACEAEWEAHKSDCSAFVTAVAARLNAVIPAGADANAITQALGAGGVWQKLADGVAAAAAAQAGKFVVGGLAGAQQAVPDAHGHVVVVVDGQPLNRNKYPFAYWGRLGGVGAKDQTINWAWSAADRDKVIYAAYEP